MSSTTGNHSMDFFYLLKESVIYLLFGLIITGRSYENLRCLASCFLSQRSRFQRIRSNVLLDTESDLAYTKESGSIFQYILWAGSLLYPLNSSNLKNKRFFVVGNFKTNVCFLSIDCITWCSQQSYQLTLVTNPNM